MFTGILSPIEVLEIQQCVDSFLEALANFELPPENRIVVVAST